MYPRIILACSLVLPTMIVGWVNAEVPVIPGWNLLWHDEFDGPKVDVKHWKSVVLQNSYNNEKQYYVAEQATIVDGKLRITAIDRPLQDKRFRSARLESVTAFPPGRFEARIDLPTTQGMWPAFWLLPKDVPWPTGGEIDIMENRGSQPHMTSSAYHWQKEPGPCCDNHRFVVHEHEAKKGGKPVDFHAGFHVYAVEWDTAQLRFFVDGQLHFVVDETADRPIFDRPMNILLNLAVGGDFGGDPNDGTVFPQHMDVDYVRVWQRKGPVLEHTNQPISGNEGAFIVWPSPGQLGICESSTNVRDSVKYSLASLAYETGRVHLIAASYCRESFVCMSRTFYR